MILGSRESRTEVAAAGGNNPLFNEIVSLESEGEEELLFRVRDETVVEGDKFLGEAKVSVPAVLHNGGGWSGDLELFTREHKPAGSLTVAITVMEPSATAPLGSLQVSNFSGSPRTPAVAQPIVVTGHVVSQPLRGQVVYATQPGPTTVIYTERHHHHRGPRLRRFGFF